jgi:hypothetical protein
VTKVVKRHALLETRRESGWWLVGPVFKRVLQMKIEGLEEVGEVVVETGRVAIVDSCYADRISERDLDERAAKCVIQETTLGDGIYPVFKFTGDDGHEYLAVRLSLLPNVTKESIFAGASQGPAGEQ